MNKIKKNKSIVTILIIILLSLVLIVSIIIFYPKICNPITFSRYPSPYNDETITVCYSGTSYFKYNPQYYMYLDNKKIKWDTIIHSDKFIDEYEDINLISIDWIATNEFIIQYSSRYSDSGTFTNKYIIEYSTNESINIRQK